MELDWSTLALEIFNFLVLVWLLKRLLYQPVLDVIAQRRAAIEHSLAVAADKEAQAQALKTQYENRLADWDKEKQAAREALRRELEAERQRELLATKNALAVELEKTRVTEQTQRAELLQRLEEQAIDRGAGFCATLLERLSGPELHDRLVDMFIEDLHALPETRRAELKAGWRDGNPAVEVTGAYDLSESQRKRLQLALDELAGSSCSVQFRQDQSLLAGLKISAPPWTLDASLRDELQHFADFAHDGR
ncbi:F0F1 ATP synthase subunit delta [Methylococcus sp. EFPC2]|uniref:F0F1 ATP synthase subunit delta n=1 Tax=Methylococcus sp. EFPC2 TaxID=2812648 RepID=UPI0019689C93|nr:F0F1 ATP synthase subunit delta [Methylococcus sp. EFPC2]QSA98698.1 F0F1 ATP synthase subunit delta [Methylococcus sp. EFPC2]